MEAEDSRRSTTGSQHSSGPARDLEEAEARQLWAQGRQCFNPEASQHLKRRLAAPGLQRTAAQSWPPSGHCPIRARGSLLHHHTIP